MSSKLAWIGGLVLGLAVAGMFLYATRGRSPGFVFIPNDVSVTIPEGTNIADMGRLLEVAHVASASILLTPEVLKLEGSLFPDTYRFDRGSTAEDIIVRMRKNYPDRDQLVIASLLEKEVQTEDDMRLVTGIIQKRLDIGMALQIDATVAYGACLPRFLKGEYCDVSKVSIVDNKAKDSAYNTYTRRGLPAGPITSPGRKALDAAAHPTTSDYWYYLSAKDGTTIFSKTLEEHNRAKRKYL